MAVPNPALSIRPPNLLDLPTEVWTQVLELSVVQVEPIYISRVFRPRIRATIDPGGAQDDVAQYTQPAITQTATVLRAEGLKLYYSKNNFRYCCFGSIQYDHKALVRWLTSIGPLNRRLLRRFRVTTEALLSESTLWDQIARERLFANMVITLQRTFPASEVWDVTFQGTREDLELRLGAYESVDWR